MSQVLTVRTTCTRDCPNTCGLLATVEDGRLVKLVGDPDHPLTQGKACHKTTRHYIDRVYSPERITRPLLREGGRREAPWRLATWDEVLDAIAYKMLAIREESGPEAVCYYQGFGERTGLKLLNKYFFNLFGGATTMRGTLCGGTGQASQNLDFGTRISHDPLDHFNSASMILWARNPVSTNISITHSMRHIMRQGGRVIAIDPARTKTAAMATRHIAPNPGQDVYLAMAVAKRLLEAGAADLAFLEQHTVGSREYLAMLDRFSVDHCLDQAGVTSEELQYLAETFVESSPTSILLGWGLHRHEFAHHAIRAIDALGALSGNIGVAGGGVSQGFEEYGPYDPQYWGDHLHPNHRTLSMPKVGQELLDATDPAVRMLYITAANPVCMAPASATVAKALAAMEYIVYSGHFLDDTASLADVFLPATTFLEEEDVCASYGHNYLGPVTPAIPPVGQCKSEFRMFHELASRFEFAAQFQRNEADWLEDICAPVREQGGSLAQVREGAFRLDAPMVPYADKSFPTPSGKFQCMTEFDPGEIPNDDPEYPLRLLTIAPHQYICSERTMAEHEPLPEVRLNAEAAGKLGLVDGRPVLVQSRVGEMPAMLRTMENMRAGILVAERGGWIRAGHGLNMVVPAMASKVGEGTPYYEATVRLAPMGGQPGTPRRVLAVQHNPEFRGALFTRTLAQLGCQCDHCFPTLGEAIPEAPGNYDALVVFGGPQDAWDDSRWPHFVPLRALMRAFDAQHKPVAGICLGSQILARAYGGEVYPTETLELGFVPLTATDAAKHDPVLGPSLPVPQCMGFHQDGFTAPTEGTLLLSGEQFPNQAFRAGNCSYGFQFHFEVDAAHAAEWVAKHREAKMAAYARHHAQHGEAFYSKFLEELPIRIAETERFCREITTRWLGLGSS